MAKYTYQTATGPVEIDVDEQWETMLSAEDIDEQNEGRKHTRPDHKYARGEPISLDGLQYDGEWLDDWSKGIEETELAVDLEYALRSLTELQRRYFTLNRLNGHSYAEIARKDNISEAAVRKHIKLAVKKLKKYFS